MKCPVLITIVFQIMVNTNPNISLIQKKLGWTPKITFEDGLKKTIYWYLNNLKWSRSIMKKAGYSGNRIGNKKEI